MNNIWSQDKLKFHNLNNSYSVCVFAFFAFYLNCFDKNLISPFFCSQYPQDVLSVVWDLFRREYCSYAEEMWDWNKKGINIFKLSWKKR